MPPNYYAILGVAPSATPDEIRQAYRLRARESHPDVQPGAHDAEQRFKDIAEAYRVLSSPEARLAYDVQLRMSAGRPNASGRSHAHGSSLPELALRVVPGAGAIGALTEPTRFYLLGELAPSSAAMQAWATPLHLAVMLDRSSSMRGPNIFEAKRAIKALLGQLGEDDRLTLIAFDDRPDVLFDGTPVGAPGASMALDSVAPRGATQLAPALDLALRHLKASVARGQVTALLLITDGRTYGDEEQCVTLAEQARLLGIPIIGFGLGLEWNRDLLDRVSAVSGGMCSFVEEPARLSDHLSEATLRLRTTIATNVRLTLEPAAGVSVLRASLVAPEISDVFDGPHLPGEPVAVKFGALTAHSAAEGIVALWELLLDPFTQTEAANGQITLGTVAADWSYPHDTATFATHLSQQALVPHAPGAGLSPLEPEARLALELLTAYRLDVQADRLATAGALDEAAAALTTASLRLRTAGDDARAHETQQAASSLLASLGDGLTATLRAKYAVKNLSVFHELRRKLRARLTSTSVEGDH